MPSTLVFPDGVRLARHWELLGSEQNRASNWARIQAANIATGFTLSESTDSQFAFYAEANVDAPKIWDVFRDLSLVLLGPVSTLIMSEIDDEPMPLGSAGTPAILGLLEPHKSQLAHDGWIQFGLVSLTGDLISEVFVAPTKHFQVWLNDENRFRSIMRHYAIPEAESLEFIDEYPRTTMRLRDDRVAFHDHDQLIEHFEKQLGALVRATKDA
jgi:hypothetical protein